MLQKVRRNNEENGFSWANAKGRLYLSSTFVGSGHQTRTTAELHCKEVLILQSLPHPTQSAFIIGIPSVQNATLLYKSGPKQELVWKHTRNSPGRDLSPKPIAITDNTGQRSSQRWGFREGRRRWHHRSLLKLNADEYWDVTMFSNP